MGKSGQSTVFVIAGIVILLVAVLVVYLQKTNLPLHREAPKSIALAQDAQMVRSAVSSCVNKVLQDALIVTGLQGGFYNLIASKLDLGVASLRYYVLDGKKLVPSIAQVQTEIAAFMRKELPSCVKGANLQNVNLEESTLNIAASINAKTVDADVDYPIILVKGSEKQVVKSPYHVSVAAPLRPMLETAQKIADDALADPGFVNLDLLLESGYEVEVTPYKDHAFIYTIADRNAKVNNLPLMLLFAVK